MALTKYQKTHHPVSRTENKCDGRMGENQICNKCGRWIKKNGLHNPNKTGSLGYTRTWSDGSVVVSQTPEYGGVAS